MRKRLTGATWAPDFLPHVHHMHLRTPTRLLEAGSGSIRAWAEPSSRTKG